MLVESPGQTVVRSAVAVAVVVLTNKVTSVVAVQPLLVAVTEYVVVSNGETEMLASVWPVFQR